MMNAKFRVINSYLVFFSSIFIIICYLMGFTWIAIGFAAFCTSYIAKNGNWKINWRQTYGLKLLFIYLLYTLINTIIEFVYLDIFYFQAVKHSFMMIIIYLLYWYMCSQINYNVLKKLIRWAFISIEIMCFIEAIVRFPIWEYVFTLSMNNGMSFMPNSNSYRISCVFKHPIMCAVFLGIALCFFVLEEDKKKWRKVVNIAVIVFDIMATKSRGAILALGVVAVICLIIKKKNISTKIRLSRNNILMLLVGISMVVIFLSTFFEAFLQNFIELYLRFTTMLDAGDAGGNIVRIETMISSFKYFKDNLISSFLGRGVYAGQAFLKNNPVIKGSGLDIWYWTAGIDNQYLTLVFESGLISLILFFLIHFNQFKIIIKSNRKELYIYWVMIMFFWASSFFYESLLFTNTYLLYILLVIMFEFKINNYF